jgi:putative transposase
MLEYKQVWRGGSVIAVPAMYTSQTCLDCGHRCKDNRKTQAGFACVECGFAANADYVGAVNILRAGHARLACEVNPEVKDQQQEPTEIAA